MGLRTIAVVGVAVGLALSGCSGKGKQPTGQVVATVDGDEITATDLKNELGNFSTPDPKIRKAAEQQALNGIIARKWLAKAAEKAGVEKSPEYAQQKKRMEETLLVRLWQSNTARQVPNPSPEEVQRFVTEHPELYAQRSIIVVQQLRMPANLPRPVVEALKPVKSLDELAQLLTANKIPFERGQGKIDPLQIGPKVTQQINALTTDPVFMLPAGNFFVANQVVGRTPDPLPAQIATQHAQQYIKSTRTQETVQRQMAQAMAGAKEKVKYAKSYQPPAPAAPPAKAAAAPPKAG